MKVKRAPKPKGSDAPNHVRQVREISRQHGELRIWLKGGEPYRVALISGRRVSAHSAPEEFAAIMADQVVRAALAGH